MDRPDVDDTVEPEGFVVTVDGGDRIHFLDWGGPPGWPPGAGLPPRALLIHGLSQTAWIWTPVARRLRGAAHTVAMDLRGHGLSDAPTGDDDYSPDRLAGDVIAVAEGAGVLDGADARLTLAGHGFGAIVAAWGAVELGERCEGLVLVDGGWESLEAATGQDVDEFLRGIDEPPEVMASLRAFLADRAAFDPASWDDDQRHAAESTVVETHAGRVVPATRPHALEASVRTMFAYDPITTLSSVRAPIVAIAAADDETGSRARAVAKASSARVTAGRDAIAMVSFRHDGHNLMRYRPAEVTAAIVELARRPAQPLI